MPQWETIQDRSSYISQVRLIPPKNHSVERGNGIFEAVSKTSIPITTTKSHISHTKHVKSSKSMFKSILFKSMLIFFVLTTTASLFWQCSRPENKTNKFCSHINSSLNMQLVWTEDTRAVLHQSYTRVTQPLVVKLNNAYHWIDTKDTIRRFGNRAKTLIIVPQTVVQEYFSPIWKTSKDNVKMYATLWRQQLDDYVEYGNNQVHLSSETEVVDNLVEDKIKKTAKRILEYIDQLKEENTKAGMDGKQAKRKAQEIIKDIKEEATALKRQKFEALVFDKDDDALGYEVKSIMEVAKWERDQLQQQLTILQSRLKVENTDNIDLHFLTALKSEIDHLRANAEKKVRERAKEAMIHLEKDVDITVTTVMKDMIYLSQKDALKHLQQIYRNIYQTNEIIDNLV